MLHIITWKWTQEHYRVPYSAAHVNTLARAVTRNLKQPHRLTCITDDPRNVEVPTFPLWPDCGEMLNMSGAHLPSCYRRLKLFDPATQAALGVKPGERVLSLDLDVLVTGRLDPLFDRPESFVGWHVVGIQHNPVYNGSIWMLRAGQNVGVWSEFNPATSPQTTIAAGYFGSDQGWLSYRLIGAGGGWGRAEGVTSFPREARRGVPSGARIVCFHGRRKPWEQGTWDNSPWVKRAWQAS